MIGVGKKTENRKVILKKESPATNSSPPTESRVVGGEVHLALQPVHPVFFLGVYDNGEWDRDGFWGVVVVRWDACMGKSRGSRRAGRHLRFDQAGPPEWLPLNALFKTTLNLATTQMLRQMWGGVLCQV